MAAKFLSVLILQTSVGADAKRIIHGAEKFEDRCCCSESDPVMKYVCINPDDTSKAVYSPASLSLLEASDPLSVDKSIMGEPATDSDKELLLSAERTTLSIPTKQRTVSQCSESGTKVVETWPSPGWIAGEEKAVQLKYVGKEWDDYEIKKGGFQHYSPKNNVSHILIDDVVYKRSDKKLETEKRRVCMQSEHSALLKHHTRRGPYCAPSSETCPSKNFHFTSACGWGEKSGYLYKRVGRAGRCLPSEEQRKVGGLFGKSGKCPENMYHNIHVFGGSATSWTNVIRRKSLLFCDCGDECN